jgi:hypothetical protein
LGRFWIAQEYPCGHHRQAQPANQCDGRRSQSEGTDWIAELGGTPISGSPADFGKLIAEDTEKWARVIKFSRAKAD